MKGRLLQQEGMGKKTKPLAMSAEQRNRLESWVRAKTAPQRVVLRSQICLLAADGLSATAIADRMNTSRPTVMVWKKRFEEHGPDGLAQDAPRGPSPRRLDESTRNAIVDTTMNTPPAEGGHWTTRTLAKALGISNASVARVWRANGIKGRGKKSVKRAKEKDSEKRFSELLGIYVHPSVRAIVVGVGRNSRLPVLSPPESGQEPVEHCVSGLQQPEGGECGPCLSAALALLENASTEARSNGNVFVDLLAFLERVERETPDDVKLHVLVEESGKEMSPRLDQWGENHPRIHLHIFPYKCFTQNDISEIIGSITGELPFHGAPESLVGVVREIDRFVRVPHETVQPFTWTRNQGLVSAGPGLCKGVLETMKHLESIMTATLRLNSALNPRGPKGRIL